MNSRVQDNNLSDQELKESMKKLIPDRQPYGHNDGLSPMWGILIPIIMVFALIAMIWLGAAIAN